MDKPDREARILRLSAYANLGVGVLGLLFFWWTDSEAILLDGFFAIISFVMGLVTLKVARMVQRPDDEQFHFGYAQFEPGLNTIRGLILIIVCAFALASSIGAILDGGRALKLGPAIIYAVVTMLGSFMLAAMHRRVAKDVESPLVKVGADNWLMGGLLSLGVGVAFVVAIVVQGTRFESIVPYVDPVLVVIMVLAMIAVPVRVVRDSIGELLMIAPEPALQKDVDERLRSAAADLGFDRTVARMVRVGRTFYVHAHVIVPPEFRLTRIAELDTLRSKIGAALNDAHPNLAVELIFTEDPEVALPDGSV
jgi:predicted Co/Zn/Cd cation transporter (cation efflux family)